jgi:flagellar basal body-associated protein FliL
MIQLNSVVELREDRYESTRVQTEEQKAYAEQLAKQKAAIWAIILSGLVLSSVAHKIIWNMPFDDKDKKEKSSFQDSNNLRDLIESKLGFAYNAEDNTISMGGK